MKRSGRKEMEEPLTGAIGGSGRSGYAATGGLQRPTGGGRDRNSQGQPGSVEMKAETMRLRVVMGMGDGGDEQSRRSSVAGKAG